MRLLAIILVTLFLFQFSFQLVGAYEYGSDVLNCSAIILRNLPPGTVGNGLVGRNDGIQTIDYLQSYGIDLQSCNLAVNVSGSDAHITIYSSDANASAAWSYQLKQYATSASDNAANPRSYTHISEHSEYDDIYRVVSGQIFASLPSGWYDNRVGNCIIHVGTSGGTTEGNALIEKEYSSMAAMEQAQADYFLREVVQLGDNIVRDANVTAFCHGEIKPTAKCPVSNVEVRFEPTQGVWQDDYFFTDRPNKQLRMVNSQDYEAEIPMVKGRQSLLFGVRGPGAKDVASDSMRKNIVIRGTTTGTKPVLTKLRFTLENGANPVVLQNGAKKIVYESPVNISVPLDEPCGPATRFEYNYSASLGLPESNVFTFDTVGRYRLTGELIRGDDGNATGFTGDVMGDVVETFAPKLHFIPVTTRGALPGANATLLRNWMHNVSDASAKYISDYFPIAPWSMPVLTENSIRWMSAKARAGQERLVSYGVWLISDKDVGDFFVAKFGRDSVVASLTDELAIGGLLEGSDRIIAVVPEDESKDLFGDDGIQGFSASKKVIFVPVLPWYDGPHDTVAHELTHTIPYLWSDGEMVFDCGFDFHNTNQSGVAHGFRVSYAGQRAVNRVHLNNGGYTYMGSKTIMNFPGSPVQYNENNYTEWTDQCSYAHLVKALQTKPDPAVLVVRGIVSRNETMGRAKLLPLYNLDGQTDLDAASTGNWTITLKGAGDQVLARYAFEPEWIVPTHPEPTVRNIVSFAHTVEAVAGVKTVEVTGPNGAIDSLNFSANAPSISIATPTNASVVTPVGENNVTIQWTGTDSDNDKLLYTVLYSSDNGKSWFTQSFEQKETTAIVPINVESDEHLVKVIATDGTHSSESMVKFSRQGAGGIAGLPLIGIFILLVIIVGGGYWYFKQQQRKRPKGL